MSVNYPKVEVISEGSKPNDAEFLNIQFKEAKGKHFSPNTQKDIKLNKKFNQKNMGLNKI